MKNTFLLTKTSLVAACGFALISTAPSMMGNVTFGINFYATYGATSTDFDGVATADWVSGNAKTSSTVTAGGTSITTTGGLTGWYATQDYWNPSVNVTGTAPQAIFGSTLDSGKSAGLAGYSSLIQLTNVNSWLTSNNYDSLKITVYYAGYGNALVHDNFSGMSAVFFDGLVTTANAATFASTTSQVGLSSVSVQGSGPYYGIGSTVELSKGSISDNILIATQLSSNLAGKSSLGGIAAIKFEGVTAVPEPSTYALMGAVVAAGLAVIRRRRKG